jgi:hypothetical protein
MGNSDDCSLFPSWTSQTSVLGVEVRIFFFDAAQAAWARVARSHLLPLVVLPLFLLPALSLLPEQIPAQGRERACRRKLVHIAAYLSYHIFRRDLLKARPSESATF